MENQSKHTFKEMLSALLRSNRRHGRFVQVLVILAALVAVVVPLSMRQSGVAMTTTETHLKCSYAGDGAHTHNADCYDAYGNLVCPLPEKPFHTHSADCYATETVLVCGQAETEGHAHTDACYDEDGNLTCTLAEVPAHTHTDACYETRATDQLICGLEETTEEHVHGPACFETVTVNLPDPEPESAATPEAEEDPTPAQELTGTLKAKDENGNECVYLVVQVKAPQGALPKGATMSLAQVDLNKKDDLTGLTAQEKLDEALRKEAGDAAVITQTDAVDITFKDSEGNRVDPAKKVEVRITTANIRTFSDQRTAGDEAVANNSLLVLHVVDQQRTKRSDAPNAEVIRDVALTNQDEKDTSTGHEDTVLFEAQEFSAYVVARVDGAANAPTAEVQSETEAQPAETTDQPLVEATIDLTAAEDEPEPEPEQPAAPKAPAQTFSHRFSTASGQDLLVVNVSAPDGAFPLGTTMQVAWVNASQVERAVTKAVSERTDGRVRDLRAVDITFIDADGNEIEPAVPITVTFVSDLIDTADDAHVVHIDDAGRAEVVDSLGADELKSREIADQADELVIESDAFSTYVVAVTTLHKELAASDGATYDITVDAPAEAGIPQDAELRVSEIARGTAGYEDYLFQALQALGEDASANGEASARFFDIKIMSGEDEVQPQAPVKVSIQLADAAGAATASAVHFQHSSEERPEVLDATQEGDVTTFDATGFSVYGVIYTVDFEYSVNGNTYQFSLPGGESMALSDLVELLGITDGTTFENVVGFMGEVASVTFSDENLVKVTQAEGDWLLESLQPFDTEESLTITMKNGDVLTVKVTDAQQIPDAEKVSISADKSYLICYEVNGTYYLLKNDGTVDSAHHPDFSGDPDSAHDFEHLNSTYAWSFNHIFKEQDVEHHLDKNYYLIRPIDHKSQTLTLNNAGEALVQQGNNNVAVIQTEDGFILEGYHNIGTDEAHRYIHLGFDNGAFTGVDGDGVTLHIFEMNSLPTYDYTVRSADEERGTVTVAGGTQREDAYSTHYYEATSNEEKNNSGDITAAPVNHRDSGNRNKWLFDHWELDGLPLDRDQYPATIAANTLPIPHNDSKLVAYFRQNPEYVVPNSEKEPSSVEDMTGWLEELQTRNIPLDSKATSKTAEVYDYQNRIYRVDLTSKANFETFAGNLDMAFCLDVSNSMYFPSALVETTSAHNGNPMHIYQINNNDSTKNWLDRSRGWNSPYYLIADASGTATVFKIYYKEGNWRAIDASRTGEYENGTKRYFIIGKEDFHTNYGEDDRHPFSKGDNNGTTYTIYDAGDNGYNRFHYLNQSLSTSSTDLNVIAELLAVAGDASPGVNIAYNTFNKNLGSRRRDFQPASSGLTVDLAYSSGGGTRPDQAFNDAQNFNWTADYSTDGSGNTDRYVILVTDGAPQGVRDGESSSINIDNVVRTAARNLKNNSHVKLITVGLSMDSVTSGKQLLYDLADFDNNGNKMFYMAESGSDLENIFRQITKVLMEDAVVLGDITDTVSEGFYLVDKITGLPLKAGDKIDIDGNLTTDQTKEAGVVQPDGKTIKWTGQAIDSVTGWHGTVYVKAQEELLGGNAMNTNSGNATITATKYHVGGKDVRFDTTLVRDTLNLTANLPSPKVNVNELTFFNTETEWTVYLGEEVDPKQQLRALYDSLVVEEVVNTNGGLHYTISPNSIEERWNDVAGEGTAKTFSLPGLIETLIRKDSTLETKYFTGTELNWDAFLTDMLSDEGITLPYHEYGLADGSNIKITLEKTIESGEEGDLVNKSPHKTTVTGDEVEYYVLRIAYEPDYTVTPIGQGGQNTADFHTGTFGSMYQGHAAGREASTNEHVINVFAKRMKIEKVDQERHTITHDSATFVLYRKATADDTTGKTQVPGLEGEYVAVQTLTTSNGTVTTDPLPLLADNEPYYLVETKAPDGYNTLSEPLKVTIDMTGHNTWTTIADGTESQVKPDPYKPSNWLQEATIKLLKMNDDPYVPSETTTYDHEDDVTDASVTYQIINNAGAELPEAGGPGTYLHTLCGLALFAAAGFVGIASRRKESEDAA